MRQFTLRGIPVELEREIRKFAEERSTSINKAVLELLYKALGIDPKSNKRRDLSHFSGIWNEKEAADFDQAVEIFEKVDEEIWET